ncbi:thioredoxin [Tunicatimonas pelagia]|uniref:thioredoxin n=1 Tax=Tunicatimonas pelagia TaxID=931531 RepID=UPI002665EDA9|nr:thioredoxin [Tunicatimonas pelagia]WKN40730.1 thioredoxin [Tunicatimonas pelagia]
MASKKKTFSELITQSEVPILVDFYADWCGPCQALAPVVSDTARDFKETLKVVKVDVDKNQSAAMKYNIQGVPTLILFQRGKIVWRQSGLMTRRDLKTSLQKAITND